MLAKKIDSTIDPLVIDIAELKDGLFGWGSDSVKSLISSVCACDLVVFGSPTYKASYTGLLKLFLDLFPANGLAGVVAVPLMLGAGPGHTLAPEIFLKPVLVELGATCPTKGLYLLDSTYGNGVAMDEWLAVAAPKLSALMGSRAH